ncbi:MAG: class II fructose-bisphosphate aldolase [Parcubacteria group bacterium]|nr:class II fructose-bisphosphate aldolase [Parcubacteria group bacterium]
MSLLLDVIKEAEKKKTAVGHFNISDLAALKAIFSAAKSLSLPVIIGVSEGEADFIGRKQAVALIRGLREEYGWPIFLNSDHTHSFEKIKEAVEAGFDAVLFDGSKLPFEENVKATKQVVEYVRSVSAGRRSEILIEGEIGYIGGSSQILKEIPAGAAIRDEDLTTPEEAAQFVKETGVDLLSPAVGNIHGMFKNAPNPNLRIGNIEKIKKAAGVPLVLHGGSGIRDDDFRAAIAVGISVIHINTEIRLAWRQALEKSLKENPEEIAPYKILPAAVEAVGSVVEERLKLFNKLI